MALNVNANKDAATPTAPDAPQAPAPAAPQTMVLCLNKYKRYQRGVSGPLYEANVPYRFTVEQAAVLLAEEDEGSGEPIWKAYKAPKKVVVQEVVEPVAAQHQDLTLADIKALSTPAKEAPRIDIPTDPDSELDAHLSQADAQEDSDGGVNV